MKARLILLAVAIVCVVGTLFMTGYHAGASALAQNIPASERSYRAASYWLVAFAISSGLMVVSLLRVALYHRQQRLLWVQFDRVKPDRP